MPAVIMSAVVCLAALKAIYFGPLAALMSELFPAATRATGLGLSYNIGVTLFGGMGPAIMTWMGSFALIGDLAPGYYLTVIAVLSLWALMTIRKTAADTFRGVINHTHPAGPGIAAWTPFGRPCRRKSHSILARFVQAFWANSSEERTNEAFTSTGLALAAGLCAGQAHAEELTGTLKNIKETGAITLGFRDSSIPFSYLDDNQKPIGFAMDICYKIVDAIKTELKLDKLEVKLNPVTSSTRIPLLANGTIDLECGSTTNNAERRSRSPSPTRIS